MPSFTFAFTRGNTVHVIRTSTVATIVSYVITPDGYLAYQVTYTDPVTLLATQGQFLESELT